MLLVRILACVDNTAVWVEVLWVENVVTAGLTLKIMKIAPH